MLEAISRQDCSDDQKCHKQPRKSSTPHQPQALFSLWNNYSISQDNRCLAVHLEPPLPM